MTFFFLPMNFASQSKRARGLEISHLEKAQRRITALIHAETYPQRGVVKLEGLMPKRHYLLRGAAQLFCRADAAGTAWIELSLERPSLLIATPVI
jgi:hypothetical protein